MPTGYSFNLDGTNIYMTLAALFIAQATATSHLTLGQQLLLLGVAMLSAPRARRASPARASSRWPRRCRSCPTVPVAGMALILGVDRFMSECRSLTNFIGNAVATIVVARWEGALDRDAARRGAARRASPTDARRRDPPPRYVAATDAPLRCATYPAPDGD